MADFLPLFHIADQVQRGVVHLTELVYFQFPLDNPGEVVHNVAVSPVEGRLAFCHQIEVEIAVPVVGHPVQQSGLQSIRDALGRQGLIDHVPRQFRSRSHRGKD